VAPLTAPARAARLDAARLRAETKGLKLALRGSLACSRDRLDQAQAAADEARTRRAISFASPWSGLEWCREDEQLARVLVPLD
jgi:hypothetical protein